MTDKQNSKINYYELTTLVFILILATLQIFQYELPFKLNGLFAGWCLGFAVVKLIANDYYD